MQELSYYQNLGEELEKILRLKTHPIAIKLIHEESDIPAEAVRPVRDRGHHFALCQAFQMSRRDGAVVAMTREDHWCPEPVIGYGLAEPPEFFMQGKNRFPGDVSKQEAGQVFARQLPKLPLDFCKGVLSAPLTRTPFVPEAVAIYGQPAQINSLLLSLEYKEGNNLPCALSSHAACVYGIVPVLLGARTHVAVPCRGDRLVAMAGDDELILTLSTEALSEVVTALHKLQEGHVFDVGYRVYPDYPLSPSYEAMLKMMGCKD